ncbi:AzlD domain-containing protein [Loigolactobacillus jiayinensis]|uniref:AzlD domain-containing protein n=1 Tax=Loigolactobacillus jiayinensis TaxID=2486016 RepID=A0ABW1RCU1_9LACO|nr:AzlD domain-containing protein [Loigolactobacillus jiayinensis]
MALTGYVFWTIIGCGAVTWLSRVIPFVLVKQFELPRWLVEFLSFVPVAIMTALVVENLFNAHPGHLPSLNVGNALATLPALVTAIVTKSLLAIVVVGIVAMAIVRALGWA